MDVRKILLVIFAFGCIFFTGLAQEKVFPGPTGNSKQLFYLQRTTKVNTIVYEVNDKNGVIDKANPVKGFWIRYQERGQREELSFLQRKSAYGLRTKKIADDLYELSFVSYKKYKMYLKPGADKRFYVYQYQSENRHTNQYLYKINGGSFWSPNIDYVEISGVEPNNHFLVRND